MAQDPELIRRDIEATREHMGSTVDALAYKADVPSRTKEKVSGAVGSVKDKIGGVGSSVSDATPDGQQVKQGAKRAVGAAQSNPLGLAVGFTAAGFLAGMLLPSTRIENEKMGDKSDELIEQAKQTGQEVLQAGQQVAQEAASTAKEQVQHAAQEVKTTAQQSAQEQGQQVAESAQQSAQQVTRS